MKTFAATLMAIVAIVGLVVWIVLSIMALSYESRYAVRDVCPRSYLWSALFGGVALHTYSLVMVMAFIEYANNWVYGLIGVCYFVWSSVEVLNPCARNNLRNFEAWRLLLSMCCVWFTLAVVWIALPNNPPPRQSTTV